MRQSILPFAVGCDQCSARSVAATAVTARQYDSIPNVLRGSRSILRFGGTRQYSAHALVICTARHGLQRVRVLGDDHAAGAHLVGR